MHCYESTILAHNQSPELYQLILTHLKKLAEEKNVKYYGILNVLDKNLMTSAHQINYQVNHMWDRFYVDFSKFKHIEDFLLQLTGKGRQLYRSQLRKFEQSNATAVVESAPFKNLQEVVELCYETTSKYGTGDYYPKEAFAKFITTCGDLMRLISIYLNGKRVGVMIALLEGDVSEKTSLTASTEERRDSDEGSAEDRMSVSSVEAVKEVLLLTSSQNKKLHLWACGMQYNQVLFSPYVMAFFTAFQYAFKNNISIVEVGRTNGKMKEKLGFSPLPLYSIINNLENSI
jgi:predicted N-acyltransferase